MYTNLIDTNSQNMKHIAIIDFGSQYTHLISRRIRELEVLAKIYAPDMPIDAYKQDCIGVILSGGPQSVYDAQSPTIDTGIFDLKIPILGLCYGHQLMAKMLKGAVKSGKIKEYGRAELSVLEDNPLLANISQISTVWMSHGDSVSKLAKGFITTGSTTDCDIAAMADIDSNFYGLQFHPEVHHTEHGTQILKNFVFDICNAKHDWKIKNIIDDIIKKIQSQVKDKKIFLLVSGGVDSSVAFALLTKALGKSRVYGLYVDTGFMRKNESQEIKKNLHNAGFDNLHVLDASKTFYNQLKNITDPEEKRKIIGNAFIQVKDKAVKDLGLDSDEWLLGQGTIYPDTIETGATKHADTIKTHHNRVDAIQQLIDKGKVIEPIADFYKDEVREIGALLGLPKHMINRHPFPGPGLAIRILCHNSNDQKQIFDSTLPGLKIPHAILPIKSVGVQGDNRTYAHPLAIWGEQDWEKLDQISSNITNATNSINRVLLLLNPQAKLEFNLARSSKTLSQDRITMLQEIDDIVMQHIKNTGIYDDIWQFVIALATIGNNHFESIVLRPVASKEAMTASFYRMPKTILHDITRKILATKQIDYIFYDITNKPPATIEWE